MVPVTRHSNTYVEPGTIIGHPNDNILYKVAEISENPDRHGFFRSMWRMKLARATEAEELVFRIMES